MKFKKILGIAGLTLAATAFLAACSSSNSTSETESKKTTITLATNASPKPFNYEENGELTGYEIEVIKAVFDGLDDYELKTETTSFAAIFEGLNSDRYQLAVNNISYTQERAENYLYSAPTAINPLSLIVPKDSDIASLDDIGGKSTEVVAATATADQLTTYNEENADNPTKLAYTRDNIQAILNRLNEGQQDYKLFEGITAQAIIEDQGLDKLKVIDLPSDSQPYIYIIFAKGQEDLRDKVNARLKELEADGTLAKLSEKYLGDNYVPEAKELVSPASN